MMERTGMGSAATRVVALSAALATAGLVHGQIDQFHQTFYVDDDAPPGGDGLSWGSAFADLSDALDMVDYTRHAEIRVAGGIYFPGRGTANRSASFEIEHGQLLSAVTMGIAAGLKGLAGSLPAGDDPDASLTEGGPDAVPINSGFTLDLRGGFAGLGDPSDPDLHDPAAFTTVLSGDFNQNDTDDLFSRIENAQHVVYVYDGFGSVWIRDLVIERGFTLSPYRDGAGLNTFETPGLTLERCVFRGNVANDGGAISFTGGGCGLYDCTFLDNIAVGLGGAIESDDTVFIVGCRFEANEASYGGAVFGRNAMTVVNSTFVANGAGEGGAVYGPALINGCVFIGNEGREYGGAVWTYGSSPLRNCTLVGNTAGLRGGGVWDATWPVTDHLVAVNTIMWRNTDTTGGAFGAQVSAHAGLPLIEYCLIDGAIPDPFVLNDDPRFVDPIGADGVAWTGDEDLSLLADSPAIDRGSAAAMTGGSDLLVVGDPPQPVDIGGGIRVVGPTIDIGAFERQDLVTPCSVADVTTAGSPWPGLPDGRVTGADLSYFVNHWLVRSGWTDLTTLNAGEGAAGYGEPDGLVTSIDLSFFVNHWLEGCG